MKHVVVFSTAYHPFVGGAEIAVQEITARVRGYTFDIITARLSRSVKRVEKLGNVTVHRLGIGVPFFDKWYLAFFGARYARKLHAESRFSIVWAIMASYGGLAAARFAKNIKIPYLLTLQEGDDLAGVEKKMRLAPRWFARVFNQAHALQAISNYLLEWGEKMGFSGNQAVVIPNGVAVEVFSQKTKLREFGFADDAFVLITVSRLVKKNGVADVIRALPDLPSDVCLVVCGDGELRRQLESLVSSLKLEDRVRFVGTVAYEDLPAYVQSADVFIRPSLSEGLGNAFLEAMAAGVVVIGTPVGGIPEFLVDEKTGYFCKPNDPNSVALAVFKVRELHDLERKSIQGQAKSVVEERFTWTYVAAQMQSLFDSL